MREIVLDTETTGLEPAEGHRLVEIGCVEMMNGIATGRVFHEYIDPQRDMPREAFAVHGLSSEFLKGKPLFGAVVDAFLAFVDEAQLVIHNASFDMKFINAELIRAKKPAIGMDRVVDTLAMARRKFPGARASLDELCARFGIDTTKRVKHGALLDAELLTEVYIELTGGRQASFGLSSNRAEGRGVGSSLHVVRTRPSPLPSVLDEATLAAHRDFIATLGESAVWKKYGP